MKELIINYIGSNNLSEIEKLKIEYGINNLNKFIKKFIIIVFISFLLNKERETLCFIFIFMLLKSFSFGIHLNTSFQCLLLSILVFNFIPIICEYIIIKNKIIFFLISLISFILFSPADTEKKPIYKYNLIYKLLSILILILLYYLKFDSYMTTCICIASFLQSLFINPIIYFLFGLKFRNGRG